MHNHRAGVGRGCGNPDRVRWQGFYRSGVVYLILALDDMHLKSIP